MASNAYRRRHGAWPQRVRFAPGHFAAYASGLTTGQLELLCTAFEITVSTSETSPRLTVSGKEGSLTYDDGVEEPDWDAAPFDAWLLSEAERVTCLTFDEKRHTGDASRTEPIKTYFTEYFRNWGVQLPAASVASRTAGHIFERGWHIGYLWGHKGDDEYLEVLAQHRMTNDRHFRVFASGRVEDLPTADGFCLHQPDATTAERSQAERESVERNRRVYADLRERGLLPPAGKNLGAHDINEYLRSGGSTETGSTG
jgi:hypothetical protein